jgi:hypothetical protein
LRRAVDEAGIGFDENGEHVLKRLPNGPIEEFWGEGSAVRHNEIKVGGECGPQPMKRGVPLYSAQTPSSLSANQKIS